MTDSFLSRLILPALISSSFSDCIRSRRTEAGSSLGSCGTSLPRMARSSIFDFVIEINFEISSCSFLTISIILNIFLQEAAIRCCSSIGGTGRNSPFKIAAFIPATVLPVLLAFNWF